jgi:hypothetical protein
VNNRVSFDPATIRKAVAGRALRSPWLLYPAVGSALAGLAAALLKASALTLGAAGGGAALALAGWWYEYRFKGKAWSAAYVAELQQKLQREREEKMQALVGRLREVRSRQGMHQLHLLNGKFANFQEILAGKFSPEEITYGRYLGIAEQVMLAGLDNLDKVYFALKSISTVGADEIRKRLKELEGDASRAAEAERKTLNARLGIQREQQERVRELLLQNEQALTEMDHAMAKVAAVQTERGQAELDLEQAMQELKRLAERAKDYGD